MVALLLEAPPAVYVLTGPGEDLDLLVGSAQSGDRGALEALLRASYDRVYPVCRRIVGNETDAADAAQEALISVARSLARFDRKSRFSTWLYRIAVNASIDECRRRARRPVPGIPARPGPTAALVTTGPEEAVGLLDIEAALGELPVEFRAAVVLRDVCGMDYAEIADVLAVPGGTVRSRIARGRSLLAARLGATPEESR